MDGQKNEVNQARLNAALAEMALREKNFEAGREAVDILLRTHSAVFDAKRSLASTYAEHIKITEEGIQKCEQMEQVIKKRVENGLSTQVDHFQVRQLLESFRARLLELKLKSGK